MTDPFDRDTITSDESHGYTSIRCRKGLWRVDAPTLRQALAEARRYHAQYLADGEYDDNESEAG